MPQSWSDLIVMSPMDPRGIISSALFQSQAGAMQAGSFTRSSTYLHPGTWINPPMAVSLPGAGTTSNIVAGNLYDFGSVEEANMWNGLHAMTVTSNQIPIAVQKIMFLKADPRFINNLYLDFIGATSTDIQLSMRDNSTTSGDFQGAAAGTVPVFAFPNVTYGGVGRNLQVTLLRTGRFQVGLRIIDNGGNYSIFEMEWIVL